MNSVSRTAQKVACEDASSYLGYLELGIALLGLISWGFISALGIIPSFNGLTSLLILASLAFMFVRISPNVDLLHPVRIFGALWCFCLALASLRLLPDIISDWNFFMWACVITALVTFCGGFAVAVKLRHSKKMLPAPASPSLIPYEGLLPNNRALAIAAISLAIGLTVLGYEYYLIGEIPALSSNVDAARTQLFGIAGQGGNPKFDTLWIKLIHPLIDFAKYGVFLACMVLFQPRQKSLKVKLLALLIIGIGTLAYISQGGRMFIVVMAMTIVALFHYLHRPIKLSELGVAGFVLILVVGILGSLRAKQSDAAPLFQKALSTSRFPEGSFWDGVAFGYAGCTLSLEVFNRLTEDLPHTSQSQNGGYLFYAFHRFIPRSNIQEVDFDAYSSEMVTPTFLGEMYADYRYWGIFWGPLVLGLAYGWVYIHGGEKNPMYWIFVRAMFFQMLLFFPYVNLFSFYLNWIFDLFFMYWLLRSIKGIKTEPLSPTLAG